MRALISAYACEPGKGSEPGVGWNIVQEIAKFHEVWVLTRANNRPAIEAEQINNSVQNLRFVYYDLPPWARWWKRGQRGVHLYYYLWQIGVYFVAKRLHSKVIFDVVHHLTFGMYWAPSFLSLLPIPFVWGPVGGGESAPNAFKRDFSLRGKVYETIRDVAQWIGRHDPFVRTTALRSKISIVTTSETSARVSTLGARRIETVLGQTAINQQELAHLEKFAVLPIDRSIRFISIGRLLHWKGFHLGLRAFALTDLEESEYWLIGDGPERKRLEALATKLGIAGRVNFWGSLPREETLQRLGQSHVLVHPSLHDFSPTVCLEAMAAGRPVICFQLGGPPIQVTEEAGVIISVTTPKKTVQDLGHGMIRLGLDVELRKRMGEAGQRRVRDLFSSYKRGWVLAKLYDEINR